jgi:hypothetical protein
LWSVSQPFRWQFSPDVQPPLILLTTRTGAHRGISYNAIVAMVHPIAAQALAWIPSP